MDPDKIKANLNTKRIGKKILVYKSTSSTNDIAAEYAKNKENDGLAIFAEEQTAGRGRAGSKWYSPCADSVLCSIVLTDCKFSIDDCRLPIVDLKSQITNRKSQIFRADLLSLTAAVAVAEAIGKLGGNEAKIKWPNDVFLNGKKVAGILLESTPCFHEGNTVIPAEAGIQDARRAYIIGIGINCHQTKDSFPTELQPTATSIDIESRSIVDRILLAKRLLISVDNWLEVAATDSEKVMAQWRKLSTLLNQRVTLIYDGQKFTGNCIGIDPEKGLILQLDTGGVRMFDAAHTTM